MLMTTMKKTTMTTRLYSSSSPLLQGDNSSNIKNSNKREKNLIVTGVVAPLKYVGPYACLGLKFPDLTKGDKEEEKEDKRAMAVMSPQGTFVLDTGANVNSIQQEWVSRWNLPLLFNVSNVSNNNNNTLSVLVGATTSSSSSSSSFKGGNLHGLGNVVLQGLPPPDQIFLRNLTAVALPFAAPVGDGILGASFLSLFPGGVEFDWYGTDGDPPTLVFYYYNLFHDKDPKYHKMIRVPLQPLILGEQARGGTADGSGSGGVLWTVSLDIVCNNNENGTSNKAATIQALVDTGSPITVLSQQAARLASIHYHNNNDHNHDDTTSWNRNHAIDIVGVAGKPATVLASKKDHAVEIMLNHGQLSLGKGRVFVGDLDCFEQFQLLQQQRQRQNPTANNSNVDPLEVQAILGLDFLRRNVYRLLLQPLQNEMWIEKLGDTPEELARQGLSMVSKT